MEAAGRVQVFARVRPLGENEGGFAPAVTRLQERSLSVRNDFEASERILAGQAEPATAEPREYTFDGVFSESAAQRDVFTQVGLPVLRESMRGINGTILAYGQTGSGKTHSLLHQSVKTEEAGLLPRLVASLFLMASQDGACVYDIEAAAVQIYNEQVDDLLHPDHQGGMGSNLTVRDGGIVPGLTWLQCTKPDDMLDAFTRARANVVYAETKMNKASSRSHAVFQLRITKRDRAFEAATSGQKVECTIARLNVVDLAGSERVKKSGAEGDRFKEATNINKSLLAFGNVVSALAAKKVHVPLRDSKLTRILDGSIGGNCRTALLVCASPAIENVPETLNTFDFASRAMRVEVDAKVNTAIVEVSAKALLADLGSEAHKVAQKAQVEKKELEALKKQSQQAQEKAREEAEKREKVLKEAEGQVQKYQQAAEEAEQKGRHWQKEILQLRKDQEAVAKEAEQLRKSMEKATADAKEARAAAEEKAKEAQKLRHAMERAENDALEWRAAAESRAEEVREVRVVQAKKDTAEIRKKKEEVAEVKKISDDATKQLQEAKKASADAAKKLQEARKEVASLEEDKKETTKKLKESANKLEEVQKELLQANDRINEAEARALAADEALSAERDRSTAAAENALEESKAEAEQRMAEVVREIEEALQQEIRAKEEMETRLAQELQEAESRAAEADLRNSNLEADLSRKTEDLQQQVQLTEEAKQSLEQLRQEMDVSLRVAQQRLQQQEEELGSLRKTEQEAAHLRHQLLEAQEQQEEEKERLRGELASLEALMNCKASEWEDTRAGYIAAADDQRKGFEEQLETQRVELEARLAAEKAESGKKLDEAQEEIRKTEERWKELKELAVRDAWENGNAQQRRLAAAFKAARNIGEMKESELKSAHDELAQRFANRESREEDLEAISHQQRRIQEQHRHLINQGRNLKDIALELQNRDECDRIFGSAEKRKPKNGMGERIVGKKLGETNQFVERERKRASSATPNKYKVLLGNVSPQQW